MYTGSVLAGVNKSYLYKSNVVILISETSQSISFCIVFELIIPQVENLASYIVSWYFNFLTLSSTLRATFLTAIFLVFQIASEVRQKKKKNNSGRLHLNPQLDYSNKKVILILNLNNNWENVVYTGDILRFDKKCRDSRYENAY